MNLAILTVVYNTYDILDEFFSSLSAQISNNKKVQVYVADLSPKPKDYPYPDYVEVHYSENKGYAHGVNVALVHALRDGYAQFVVANSDIIFANDFVAQAETALTAHLKTVIGGKIYYAKGYEYHKDRYQSADLGNVLWYAGGTIDWDHVITHHTGVDEVDAGQYDNVEKTGFVTGCLMAFDKAVVDEVGFWDEHYFLYYEDSDFCQRALEADVPLLYTPKLVIWHKNAQSTDGSGSDLHVRYQTRNRLRFGLKYAPLKTKIHLVKNAVLRLLRRV